MGIGMFSVLQNKRGVPMEPITLESSFEINGTKVWPGDHVTLQILPTSHAIEGAVLFISEGKVYILTAEGRKRPFRLVSIAAVRTLRPAKEATPLHARSSGGIPIAHWFPTTLRINGREHTGPAIAANNGFVAVWDKAINYVTIAEAVKYASRKTAS